MFLIWLEALSRIQSVVVQKLVDYVLQDLKSYLSEAVVVGRMARLS
jgi:hypothetical protein